MRYDAQKIDHTKCPVIELQVGTNKPPAIIEKYGRCTPRVCMKHWPNGPASLDDWKRFREMKDGEDHPKFREIFTELGDLTPEEWIDEKARIKNKLVPLDNMDLVGNAPKSNSNQKPKSFISKMLNKLRI